MRCALLTAAGVVTLALAGCGGDEKVSTRGDMGVSRAAYQFCLAQHPDAPETCDSARLSYEAGMKAYRDNSVRGLSGRNQ
jgi:hypothetical protein